MKRRCPNPHCHLEPSLLPGGISEDPRFKTIVRKGYFYRTRDRRRITRYRCQRCGKHFSSSTHSPDYRQKKRDLNPSILKLFASGVSQRRMARILDVNTKTIVRKFHLLANRAHQEHLMRIERLRPQSISAVQFDDLETFEHTKCKPLSVSLAVNKETRELLAFEVSRIPARGHLAKISRRKYGHRKDERPIAWTRLFETLQPIVKTGAIVESDENPHYPRFVMKHMPGMVHLRYPGARGAITGQGELKKLRFDPLFSLNHSFAMLRANINRLFRKTWCTTKKPEGLIAHIWIYLRYHNTVLIRAQSRLPAQSTGAVNFAPGRTDTSGSSAGSS